jgi:hypothetical protein
MPVLAAIFGWTWAELTTSEAACPSGEALRGPSLGGSALLVVVAAAPVAWRARSARLPAGESAGLVVASMVLSAFLIALAIAVWEIGHHCAA